MWTAIPEKQHSLRSRSKPRSFFILVSLVLTYYAAKALHHKTYTPVFHSHDLDLTKAIGAPTYHPDPKHLVKAANGAVACDVPLCSRMGTEILMKGGNAADAAITVALCIGVVNSHSSGIGGGGFIVSKPFGEGAVSIDAREMAPQLAEKDMFNYKENQARVGGLAIGIPGELKGLDHLYRLHASGNLGWSDLVMPVVHLAKNGWEVSKIWDRALASEEDYILKYDRADWDWVFNDDGNIKRLGDWVNRPALAKTLELVARNGSSDIFYDPDGPIASSLAHKAQQKGGILTRADFAKYDVRVTDALHTNFSDESYTLYTAGGASSGIALIAGVNTMDQFDDLNDLGSAATDLGVLETHRLVEVFKWIASARSNLGDVSIYSDNKTEIEDHARRYARYQSKAWAHQTYTMINDSATLPSWKDYDPAYEPNEPHGTAHFSVVDKDNNAVAMTTTVNLLFGAMVHDPVTGVVLNDEMDDFSIPTAPNAFGLEPSIYNWIAPFKRPLSSTAPSIIVDNDSGRPDFVIGCAGGSRILTAVLQAIIRRYHYKLELLDIIARPRAHHQLLPETLFVESPGAKGLKEGLESKGHDVELVAPVTAMNAIAYNAGEQVWEAVSDYWRKLGQAAGY